MKTFEFVSQLRRASVIVRSFGARGGDIYVKGAPECMKEICRPDSCRFFRGPFFVALRHFINSCQ